MVESQHVKVRILIFNHIMSVILSNVWYILFGFVLVLQFWFSACDSYKLHLSKFRVLHISNRI